MKLESGPDLGTYLRVYTLTMDFVQSANLHQKQPTDGGEIQKEKNKAFSAQRVACEHAHAGIKRYNAVTSIYRNRVADFDDHLMLIATGLWNLYLEAA